MARCPECKGKKIIELYGGVIMTRCNVCKGKGEIEDDTTGGIKPVDKPVRSASTRKPRKSKKRKARKVSTA